MERLSRKELLLDMLSKEPKDVFLNYALAMEHLSEQDFRLALQQLLNTLSIQSDYLPCYYQIGQVNEKLGDTEKALEYYKKGLTLAQQQNNKKAMGELNEAIWMLED